jgi:vacuolar-type H+-ATPase subunit E/Vma4
MGCGCGGASNIQAMTSAEVNAMLEQARAQAKNEMEAMIASAQQAAINAGGQVPQPAPAQ